MRKLTPKEIEVSGLVGYTRFFEKGGKIYGANDGDSTAKIIKGAVLKPIIVDEKRLTAEDKIAQERGFENGDDFYNWLRK